jgi:putative transposase
MKENGIRPPRGRRRVPITTYSRHAHAVAPNLRYRNFGVLKPERWLTDISYIPADEAWLYLAAVKDLATTEIVGCSRRSARRSSGGTTP